VLLGLNHHSETLSVWPQYLKRNFTKAIIYHVVELTALNTSYKHVSIRRDRSIVVVQKHSVIPTFFSTTTYAAIPYFGT